MLIPGLNGWSRLTRASRDAILRRVREGAGLVLLHPFVGDVKGHPFDGDEAEGDTRLWDCLRWSAFPTIFVDERGYPELNTAAISKARWERALAVTSSPRALPWSCSRRAFPAVSTTTSLVATCSSRPAATLSSLPGPMAREAWWRSPMWRRGSCPRASIPSRPRSTGTIGSTSMRCWSAACSGPRGVRAGSASRAAFHR